MNPSCALCRCASWCIVASLLSCADVSATRSRALCTKRLRQIDVALRAYIDEQDSLPREDGGGVDLLMLTDMQWDSPHALSADVVSCEGPESGSQYLANGALIATDLLDYDGEALIVVACDPPNSLHVSDLTDQRRVAHLLLSNGRVTTAYVNTDEYSEWTETFQNGTRTLPDFVESP